MENENNLPLSAKIIGWIWLIISLILPFLMVKALFFPAALPEGTRAGGYIAIVGIILVLLSILSLIFSIMLIKKVNFGRIALGIFSFIPAIYIFMNFGWILVGFFDSNSNLWSAIGDLLMFGSLLCLSVFSVYYLLFNKEVKEAFAK